VVPGQTATSGAPNPQQLNRYSYVANNPLTTNDPSGHDDEIGLEINGEAGGGTAGGSGGGVGYGGGSSGSGGGEGGGASEPIVPPASEPPATTQMGPEGGIVEADVGKSVESRARFEVTENGVAIPTSKTELKQGFENAGFDSYSNQRTAESGTNYVDPQTGKIYRVMDGSEQNPPRLMTHAPAGNPMMPDGTKIPSGVTGKEAVRNVTHFRLEP